MAEAHRAKVSFSVYNLFAFVLGTLLLACCFYDLLFSTGVAEERGCTWCCCGTIFAGYEGACSEGSISSC